MQELSYYLRTTATDAVHDLYMALHALFGEYNVDDHIPNVLGLLATVDDRADAEVAAFLQSIFVDQTTGILLAHRIDVEPETLQQAYDLLYSLKVLANLDDQTIALSIVENADNSEDGFAELVAYACETQAEDYLPIIHRVAPEALEAIEYALMTTDATEDEDYDELDSETDRLSHVPHVRKRVLAFQGHYPTDTVVVHAIKTEGLKLALSDSAVMASLRDRILALPEKQWSVEFTAAALASRLPTETIPEWVTKTLNQYTDDPLVTKSAQQIYHLILDPETNHDRS